MYSTIQNKITEISAIAEQMIPAILQITQNKPRKLANAAVLCTNTPFSSRNSTTPNTIPQTTVGMPVNVRTEVSEEIFLFSFAFFFTAKISATQNASTKRATTVPKTIKDNKINTVSALTPADTKSPPKIISKRIPALFFFFFVSLIHLAVRLLPPINNITLIIIKIRYCVNELHTNMRPKKEKLKYSKRN